MALSPEQKEANKARKRALSPPTKYREGIEPPLDPLLRRPTVEQATGLTTSALYRLVKLGDFPAPLQITPGAVGWRQSDVRRWIDDRPAAAIFAQDPTDEPDPAPNAVA